MKERIKEKKTEKQKKTIHDYVSHLSRVTVIVAIVGLFLSFGVIVWLAWFSDGSTQEKVNQPLSTAPVPVSVSSENETSPEERIEIYYTEIENAMKEFRVDDRVLAETTLATVIDIEVPSELRDFHLQLVVALQDAQQGKTQKAQTRIDTLTKEYEWFRQ